MCVDKISERSVVLGNSKTQGSKTVCDLERRRKKSREQASVYLQFECNVDPETLPNKL